MSLREFAYLGLPSIAVNVGGISDHINKFSSILLSSFEDEKIVEELSYLLIDLYKNKTKLEKIKNIAIRNKYVYSWNYSWDKILSIIK